MNNEKIDQLVEATLNPYLVFKVELDQSKEEYDKLMSEINTKISEQEINEFESNTITIELENFDYIFIKNNYYPKFIEMLKKAGLKFKLTNAVNEIWEMDNLNIFDEGDPAPELTKLAFPGSVTNFEILEQIFEANYTTDDIIDKIGRSGIESLNEIQKQMLNGK